MQLHLPFGLIARAEHYYHRLHMYSPNCLIDARSGSDFIMHPRTQASSEKYI